VALPVEFPWNLETASNVGMWMWIPKKTEYYRGRQYGQSVNPRAFSSDFFTAFHLRQEGNLRNA
jgi:hypothetical protein